MSLPVTSTSNSRSQPSIRSFFQPRQPNYAAPPAQVMQQADAPPIDNWATLAALTAPPAPVETTIETPTIVSTTGLAIPREAEIRRVEERDIQALRRVNSLLLPMAYPDAFYQHVLDPTRSGLFSRVITWADSNSPISTEPKVVGGVVCHIEPSPFNPTAQPPEHVLYIQSLCLLSPYRSLGLAAVALEEIVTTAVTATGINVQAVYAHAWTENEDGLRWYEARGFKKDGAPIEGYYFKLRPNSAWIVKREISQGAKINTEALLNHGTPASHSVPLGVTAAIANLPSMNGPPRAPTSTPPSRTPSGQSYQNTRPETEWNDLPMDMAPSMLGPPRSGGGSGASSRSSSTARKKKDRAYPAAAFGGS
jgi:N-alpha-acetyltransferase 50